MSPKKFFTKRRWIGSAVTLAVVTLLFRNPFFEIHRVEGPSMWPHFDPHGEVVVVWKRPAPARRGEVVIVRPDDDSSKTYLKRVVALGGETVRIARGDVWIGAGAAAAPLPRSIDEIMAESVPMMRLADLGPPADGGGDALVDRSGVRRIVCEKGTMALADGGGFLKLGDGKMPTIVRIPETSLADDHYGAQAAAVVPGTNAAVDLILTLALHDAADGTELTIAHQVDGNVVEAFGFECSKDAVRVRVSGQDACVVARGPEGFGAFRCVMVDQRVALLTARTAGVGAFELVHESPRRPLGEATRSRLEISLKSGHAILGQLELNRDIVYTSNRGESHFATQEPLGVVRGNVFFLGDNSAESDDGRKWGDLWEGRIVGRPVLVIWPFGRMRRL